MSGFSSSKRQWMPLRVRALVALFLTLALLIPVASAYAQDDAAAAEAPAAAARANNVLCVKGSVINWDETPLPYSVDEVPWTITATPVDPQGSFVETQTDEDANFEFDGLTVGLWDFAIVIGDGSPWRPITPANFTVSMNYGADKCAVIRFKLKRPVPVVVLKIDDAHTPLEGWTMRAEPAHGNWFASPVEVETNGEGKALFELTEGKWIFKEKAPSGTHYVPVMPDNGMQELNVEWPDDPAVELPINIRFKNRLSFKGCLDVYKTDVPPGEADAYGLPGWKITVKRANGSVVATKHTDALGYVKFENLPLGPYIVEEEHRIGWGPVTPTSYTVNLTGDTCEQIEFYNEQVPPGFCIEGRKIDTNGKVGIPGWTITVTPYNKGGYPNEDVDGFDEIVVTTDGQGKFKVPSCGPDGDTKNCFPTDDYRIPGSTYKVCEEERDGWLPHTALCQYVRLPSKPGACAKAWDFENQQVGHWESVVYGKPSSSSGSGCAYTHTVVAGESLYGIGAAYGVSASAMLSANSWVYSRPNYYVYPGDTVCIP